MSGNAGRRHHRRICTWIPAKFSPPAAASSRSRKAPSCAPKFDEHGLIPAVTTDHATGEVLMVGYMNAEALARTIETGEAHYFSRSRQVLWHKGATSGLVQKVLELLIDDDQDCVWLRVETAGGANCHVGYRSCFYRAIPIGADARRGRTAAPEVHDHGKGLRPEGRLRRRAEPDEALIGLKPLLRHRGAASAAIHCTELSRRVTTPDQVVGQRLADHCPTPRPCRAPASRRRCSRGRARAAARAAPPGRRCSSE